ncbi:hypothetical protein IYR97_24575 (plasmid) [Pseudomonas fulva]|jgi:hypothetical protein|uniref:Lipoprotein n=2 Tax=Pseudomonas putida group TaxID=136845 RepID=A0A1X0ZGJ7_PSEPU|nr:MULTISPECIES: hypothetical protein [Pseudomonas]MCT8162665.1 hypothetical protein [Pseudomonas sp. HD6422]MCT8181566.1 hypothetical protein [Pseudomonas sp. HD6421]MDH1932447.1 hypothetical protein [Pseudomonas sp. GD03696]ORL51950.1 hypothetical protein B7H18_07855 [Pseudomonas putida]ORL63695.1 hypothetical protein B7H17_14185 [Pseudomonas putida]
MTTILEYMLNAPLLMAAMMLIFACLSMRSGYHLLVLRSIDRTGYQTPSLQALHLLEKEHEYGRLITKSRKHGLCCIAWLAASAAIAFALLKVTG